MPWEFDVMLPNRVGRISKLLTQLRQSNVNIDAILVMSHTADSFRRVRLITDDEDATVNVLEHLAQNQPDYLQNWYRDFVEDINLPPRASGILEHIICETFGDHEGPFHALYLKPTNHDLATIALGVDAAIETVTSLLREIGLKYHIHIEFTMEMSSSVDELCRILQIFSEEEIHVDAVAGTVCSTVECKVCGEPNWVDYETCVNCGDALPQREEWPLTLRIVTHNFLDTLDNAAEVGQRMIEAIQNHIGGKCNTQFVASVGLPHAPGALVDFIRVIAQNHLNANSVYVIPQRRGGADLIIASPSDLIGQDDDDYNT